MHSFMKPLLIKAIAVIAIFYSINSEAIRFEEMAWVTQDQGLRVELNHQTVLKTFVEPQPCKATYCYDYVICSISRDEVTGHNTYSITRIDGASIFFRRKLEFRIEKSDQLPPICDIQNQ